ncbi:MAG: hypothetical protein J5662_00940 [Clostridia bacterium]|nr:hypothetical protein [Clostridia bacterium]
MESGKVKTLMNANSYQLRYFHPDVGTLSFEGEKTVEAELVTASVFNNGSVIAVAAISGVAVLGAVCAVIFKKKKKGDTDNNDDEE